MKLDEINNDGRVVSDDTQPGHVSILASLSLVGRPPGLVGAVIL